MRGTPRWRTFRRSAVAVVATLGLVGAIASGAGAARADSASPGAFPSVVSFPDQPVGTMSPPLPVDVVFPSTSTPVVGGTNLDLNPPAPPAVSVADFRLIGVNCAALVPGFTHCTYAISFSPTATGLRTGSLIVSGAPGGDPFGPFTVPLNGSGLAPSGGGGPAGPSSGLDHASLAFGNQGVGSLSPSLQATLTVPIGSAVTVGATNVDLAPPAPPGVSVADFRLLSVSCLDNPGNGTRACTYSLVFGPVATGPRVGQLQFSGAGFPTQTLDLTGTGMAPPGGGGSPAQGANPLNLNFGNQLVGTPSPPLSVTLSSLSFSTAVIGGTNVSLTVPPLPNPSAEFLVGAPTCVDLDPGAGAGDHGQSCTYPVQFRPTAPGPRNGSITFSNPGIPGFGTFTVQLNGVGDALAPVLVAPQVSPPGPFNFGTVAYGQTGPGRVFTIGNPNAFPVNLDGTLTPGFAGANGGPFPCPFGGAGGFTIPANTLCTILVAFQPLALGPATGSLIIQMIGGPSTTVHLLGNGGRPPAPHILSFTPTVETPGGHIAVTGSGFDTTTRVTVGGQVVDYFVVSPTELDVTLGGTPRSGIVTVRTLGGEARSTQRFIALPRPSVSTPVQGGAPGAVLSVRGLNLADITGASFAGLDGAGNPITLPASFLIVSDTHLRVTVPIGAVSGGLTVTNAAGSGQLLVIVLPTVDSFNPPVGTIGDVVTVTGSGFTGAISVEFARGAAASFHVLDDSHLTAVVPAGVRPGAITVRTQGGFARSVAWFNNAPDVLDIGPRSGAYWGQIVTIVGQNFLRTSSLTFVGADGPIAASFSVANNTRIYVTVPVGAISGDFTIVGPGGTTTATYPIRMRIVSLTEDNTDHVQIRLDSCGDNAADVRIILTNGFELPRSAFTVGALANPRLIDADFPSLLPTGDVRVICAHAIAATVRYIGHPRVSSVSAPDGLRRVTVTGANLGDITSARELFSGGGFEVLAITLSGKNRLIITLSASGLAGDTIVIQSGGGQFSFPRPSPPGAGV